MKRTKKFSFLFLILLLALSSAAFADDTYHYATTDMTWAEFYAAETGETADELKEAGLDAYTSATTRNYTSFPLTSADVQDGKTYYYGVKAVQVRMSDDVYALLSGDSRYTWSGEIFSEYKEVNADGSFGKMIDAETTTLNGTIVTASSGGSSAWGTYTLRISSPDIASYLGVQTGDSGHGTARKLLGATITTSNEKIYGLRPNSNTFSESALALTINDKYSEPHNADNRPYEYTKELGGATITEIKYILKDSPDIVIPCDVTLAKWTDASVTVNEPTSGSGFLLTGSEISFPVEFKDADGITYTVKSVTKPGARRHSTIAMEYEFEANVLTLTSTDQLVPATYTVIFEDTAGEYVDIKTTFNLYTTDASSVMSDNAAGLMLRITPAGAVSSVDAVLEENNFVNATDYTTSSDNYSAAYTPSEQNFIKDSGFTFDVALKDVPDGKTAILGFGKSVELTATTLGSADLFEKVSAAFKLKASTEEGGMTWYSIDGDTLKELGISVKSTKPDRDLTDYVSVGAAFLNDETILLVYGAMLADSASVKEDTYILSPEGEILFNDGAADGHIKAAWYLTLATAAGNGNNNNNSSTGNNEAGNTSGGNGGIGIDTRKNMATPKNASISEATEKAKATFAKESVVEKIVKELQDLLGSSIPEEAASEVKALPSDIGKEAISLTQEQMVRSGIKFDDPSEDNPIVLETLTITESAVYYIPVPEENLTAGMKIFIHLLKNVGNILAADTEEVEAVFVDSDGNVIDTVPSDTDVNIVAYMEEGNTYTPVFTSAENNSSGTPGSSSGGCNVVGIFSSILLLGALKFRKRK